MQSTRQEILDILKEERQATVEDLATRLGLTPMTIRHHLNVLQAQNLVEASKVRRSQKVGRPRLVYTLTAAADDLFPQNYSELARNLVTEVKETLGTGETQAIFRRIAERMAQDAPPPVPGQTFEQRLDQVTIFLEAKGFLFRWEKRDEGYVMSNINCPYRNVTQEHVEVCAMDAILIDKLLGVEAQQVSNLQQGDDACTCLIVAPNQAG